MQVNGTRLLRVKAVAEMFDVSPQTIYRAIAAGKLPALRISGVFGRGSVRVPESALAAFAQQCARAATPPVQASPAGDTASGPAAGVGVEVSGEVA